jgi:hypothetical protein
MKASKVKQKKIWGLFLIFRFFFELADTNGQGEGNNSQFVHVSGFTTT